MSEGRFNPPIVATYSGSPAANATFCPLFVGDNPFVTVYGSTSLAGTVTAVYSNDGQNWYASQQKQVLGAAGNFAFDFTTGAAFVGLQFSVGSATIAATVSAKG